MAFMNATTPPRRREDGEVPPYMQNAENFNELSESRENDIMLG
jgi:hypothetical protein